MRDIVFLLGAGASYGAGSILPERPPLGSQLYRELRRSYPGSWGALPKDMARQFEVDFEKGMRFLHDEFGGAIPQLMREMAIYFAQFRPVNRASLYCLLIEALKADKIVDRVILSTLNYECVLEFSMAEAGLGISYFDEGSEDTTPLWKLHGSCNMFSEGLQAGQGVSYGIGVVWDGGIRALQSTDAVIHHCLAETGLAPVMSLYMEGKPLSVSPSALKSLQARWARAITSARLVCCVGVRPLPADEHIWSPIYNSPARLVFLGDSEAFDEWRQGRVGPSHFLASRFSDGFSSLLQKLRAC